MQLLWWQLGCIYHLIFSATTHYFSKDIALCAMSVIHWTGDFKWCYNKFCVAHLPGRYIQCYTKDSGSRRYLGRAEIDWFELASLIRYTYGVSPAVTWAESDVIWIVIWCQTVVLSIEGSVVSPPHVRPLLWSPYVIGRPSCDFYLLLSSFFPRLISAVGDWMFTILWHMVWP